MKYLNIIYIVIMFNSITLSSQGYNISNLVDKYVMLNLESDVYYYLDFKKNEIPLPKLWYSKERISMNYDQFNIPRKDLKKIKEIDFNDSIKSNSNYIVFNTGIVNNYLIVEVFFKREEFLNIAGETEYESWRRYNGGMAYLFHFNDKGYLEDIKKTPINYD